ncbi:MAG: Type I Iterative PKS [Pycnora praestabilis]|nr:MAG: Type I Iterative PKS [Pycnora praestabilis]
MPGEMKIFLFGNQVEDTGSYIRRQLLLGRSNPLLSSFLQRVSLALRYEFGHLSPLERKNVPDFTTIEELVDRYYSSGVSHAGVERALLCISQLTYYMEYAGDLCGEPSEFSKACVVGLGTGLLPAAAVASSPALPSLISLGVEVVLIAFRIGVYIGSVVDRIQRVNDGSAAWSFVIPGISESAAAAAIDTFHAEKGLPASNHAYISAINSPGVTISGPSSTLAQLFETNASLGTKRSEVPRDGPYHAPHLHRGYDTSQILHSSETVLAQYSPRLPVISTSKGSWFEQTNTLDLLTAALNEILNEPLRFDHIFNGCIKAAVSSKHSMIRVISTGPSDVVSRFITALKNGTDAEIVLQEDHSQASPSSFPRLNQNQSSRISSKPKLAIVGMAGRFPNSSDHEKFWELLEAGLDVHREIPKERFPIENHYDPAGKKHNTSHTPFGCFIDEPGLFDPRFFNMSPREAYQTDPMHRLSLATAYEALEMSGYVPNRTPSTKLDRVGTFYGQTSDDWREINAAQDVDTYLITGGVRAFSPGRINYHFKFSGPSFSIDTACSSSMAAIQLACTSLWAGECDTAIAGGSNVMTNSDIFSGLSRAQFLSKTGNCQTFDNDADGYCRGDGVATVIIKRLEDAQADNDRILGVILESATNHSANAVSITHPHAPTQEQLFKMVMDKAGIDPHEVNYVEMHGTGTQAGDGTEMKSVTNVFAPSSRKGTRKQSLHLGSVKSNVGHGEAVSGVTALVKVLLMMEKNTIPPHCGIKKTINQGFPADLAERNVHIAFKSTPLAAKGGAPRRIFVNNFSAAGGNTALLLEDAPKRTPSKVDPRPEHIIAVSAKSKSAMRANTRRLITYIDEHPNVSLANLSYTLTARRIQHEYRIAASCNTLSQAREMLASRLDDTIDPTPSKQPGVAFVFTGQGSHYAALAKELYEESSQFRSDIHNFKNLTCNQGYPSFLPLIEGNVEVKSLSPLVVQLGICCIQMALTRLWASWGVKPDVVLGHSLGEYAALNAAGVISTSETIYLVAERAKLLQDECTSGSHAMLATRSSSTSLKDMVIDVPGVEVACVNGPQETVLSGTVEDINVATEKLNSQGVKCTKLNVPYAFHSSQVDPILEEFERMASSVMFNKPNIPVISPLMSAVLGDHDCIDGHYLSRHAREAVDFSGGIAAAQQLGLINDKTVWIEIGPHPVCLGMVKSSLIPNTVTAPSLRRGESPFKTLSSSLCSLHKVGVRIDWNEYQRDFVGGLQMLDLPAYAFDNKNYWIQYVGNWNLTKGQQGGLITDIPEVKKAILSTTTVQTVISEEAKGDVASVVIESDVSRPDLLAAISGHLVNGTPLCPSSLYADMALTVGDYLYRLLRPETEKVDMNVCNVEVFKPFIANSPPNGPQMLRLSAKLDLALGKADLLFSSMDGKIEHCKMNVMFGSGSAWLAEWQRNSYLINSRVKSLQEAAAKGDATRMKRGMAYKLFTALVDYDPKYRGMEEVILDSDQLEATAQVVFQTKESDGNFHTSPYWIDSCCHLGGFIVNATDAVDSGTEVYISHGWETMRFAEPLSASKTYRSYVRMQPVAGSKMVAGDVYIFNGDRIIGMCGGLKFQCIPRTLLNTFLPPKGAAAKAKPVAISSLPAPSVQRSAPKAVASKATKALTAKVAKIMTAGPSISKKAFGIMASETGVEESEFADGVEFENLGVDSLMALSISGRLREELEINLQSSVFTDYPTVGEMKTFLGQFDASDAIEAIEEMVDGSERIDGDGSTTPSLTSENGSSSQDEALSTPPTPRSRASSDSESLSSIIRETIAGELGVELQEVIEVDDLSCLGMDSLMSLSILGVLRERTGLSLGATFLADNPSIKMIEDSLVPKKEKPKSRPAPDAPVRFTDPLQKDPALIAPVHLVAKTPERKASSVLLQGNPRTAEKQFWLVPDGSGSATSYIFMPDISPRVAVWGLNSPWMKTPEEYTCGVVGIATKMIAEIKRRQPKGPYNIGGWSAGGVISFETCRQLIEAGEIVDTLCLIDTPCPLIIEPLPASLHRFFGEIGLLGEGDGAIDRLPAWLLPHFAASVRALSTYDAKKIDSVKCPKVFAIWCEDGVCKFPEDRRPDPYPYGHAQWLLENRTDFGPNLWDEYLDKDKIQCRQMTGNHFSMMRDPIVPKLTAVLREALL